MHIAVVCCAPLAPLAVQLDRNFSRFLKACTHLYFWREHIRQACTADVCMHSGKLQRLRLYPAVI